MDRIKNIESTRKTPVLSLDQFLNEDNGFQIKMEDFDAELASSYKEISGNDMKSTIDSASASGSSERGEGESVNKSYLDSFTQLARKTLPSKLGKLETSDLLDTNGSLKKRYSGGFIRAWEAALKSSDSEIPGYFFYDGGLYETDSLTSSLNTPCNWSKWSSLNGDKSPDNINAFIQNYQASYTRFAKLPNNNPYAAISLFHGDGDYRLKNIDYDTVMDRLKNAVSKYQKTSYITYDDIVAIRNDINMLLKVEDWGRGEFITFNNILVVLANSITFHGDKIISGFRWVYDNSNIMPEAGRINSDLIKGRAKNFTAAVLAIEKSKDNDGLGLITKIYGDDDGDSVNLDAKTNPAFSKITPLTTSKRDGINATLAQNLYYMVNGVYSVLIQHVKRMNAKEFSNVPQPKGNTTFDASKK